jgi:hypothetical protein
MLDRRAMKNALFVSLALSFLALGCECGHHDDDEHEAEHEGEAEGEAEGEGEGEAEPEAPHATGPLGWTAVVESGEEEDDAYLEHRLLLGRTGPATGERPPDLAELGHFSNWQGLFTLYVAGEEEGGERTLTLFGIRGTCEATASRALHLRVHYEPHHGDDEERLYDALEFEGCDGPFAFGAEGPITYEELSTRTMDTPPPEVAAVVHDREQAITDDVGDEPMRLVGRELPAFDAWVLAGWETYVVRGTEVVASSEGGILAAVTIGERSVLLVRGDDGPALMTVGGDGLERVDPDAAPTTMSTAPSE